MNRHLANELIASLKLLRHPEGGWFRETYRAEESISSVTLPDRVGGDRAVSTAIYFLLERGDVSALHRIKSDELWHFYSGARLTIHVLTPAGEHREILLGPATDKGETFQAVVMAGCWFGAEVTGEGEYTLVGCTVAPGFDFADFEMGVCKELSARYPEHVEIIRQLSK